MMPNLRLFTCFDPKTGPVGLYLLGLLFLMTACQPAHNLAEINQEEENGEKAPLEFQVFSQARPEGDTTSTPWDPKEFGIYEIYIYAFDNDHTLPDYYRDFWVNGHEGALRNHTVRMPINGKGEKRFYLLANPPQYVKEHLTFDCTEQKLKSLTIELKHPLKHILDLPQDPDGETANHPAVGFPMSNQFTAYVTEDKKTKGKLLLTASSNTSATPITRIPIFRTLGKVTVTIQKQIDLYTKLEAHQELFVKSLRLFNYTRNGFFLPFWNTQAQSIWNETEGRWNPQLTLDLGQMIKNETKVGVDAESLVDKETVINETETTLTTFYLCQNSFGNPMPGDRQEGVTDSIGNRTTKLAIQLSDGRQSVVDFPYLRRNDHLKIHIRIHKNKIKIIFLPWESSEVTPDWEEEINPPCLTHNDSCKS